MTLLGLLALIPILLAALATLVQRRHDTERARHGWQYWKDSWEVAHMRNEKAWMKRRETEL